MCDIELARVFHGVLASCWDVESCDINPASVYVLASPMDATSSARANRASTQFGSGSNSRGGGGGGGGKQRRDPHSTKF